VTLDEVRELNQRAQQGKSAVTSDRLAGAAKGLSFIKDAKLPPDQGSAVMTEALRQGFDSLAMQDLGREVRRREADYRTGRASLIALRDAIARGDRPDQLLRDSRAQPPERPAATRPSPPAERPARPEVPARPEAPARPERPAGTRPL
jgi:hypothetical protein